MIGFLLGQQLTRSKLARLGRVVLTVSGSVVLCTPVIVFLGLMLFGAPLVVALLLAGIATATAPAASVDVVREARASGDFSDILLGIVAIDDAWGLIVFTLLLAAAEMVVGQNGVGGVLLQGLWELSGAILLGVALGLPMAYLTGRIRPGEPTQAEALGLVLLCAGIAEWLGVSYILSAMLLGATVANLARHHTRPFDAIEGLEWPFLILFFLLAGAALDLTMVVQSGALLALFVVLRIVGRVAGCAIGGRLADAPPAVRRWMGLALLPQAGLAIGMALLASQRFPIFEQVILPVVLGATVLFEIVGPVVTRRVLVTVGEAGRADAAGHERPLRAPRADRDR
jgi:Kef-type K+ transport system membrane component KefB